MGSHMQRVSFKRNGEEVGCGMCEVRESPDHSGVYGFLSEIARAVDTRGIYFKREQKLQYVVDPYRRLISNNQ